MNPRSHWFLILLVFSLAMAVWLGYGHSQGVSASQLAAAKASRTLSPTQRRLWQELATDPGLPHLERLPPVRSPVKQRQTTVVTDKPQPLPSELPPRLINDLRLLDFNGGFPFAVSDELGSVKSLKGDQIVINTKGRTITLLARINKKPIQTKLNQAVQVEAVANGNPYAPRTVIGLRFRSGPSILQLLESGDNPIRTSVKGFALTAVQTQFQPDGQSVVEVSVGKSGPIALKVGQSFVFDGGLEVTVQSSSGPAKDSELMPEGAQYVLVILAKSIK
jgi:hypothetical protein